MSEEWTLEELERRIDDSIYDSQDSRVLFGALFLKLYGRLPLLALSESQCHAAIEMVNRHIPNSEQTIMASNQIGKTALFNLERENERYKNIISEISKIIEAEKGR